MQTKKLIQWLVFAILLITIVSFVFGMMIWAGFERQTIAITTSIVFASTLVFGGLIAMIFIEN